MREILFRGKRTDNGKWVYGDLAAYDLISPEYPEDVSDAMGKYYDEIPYVGFVEVDPKTVGQFTGLTAKGKKIFEGDILSTENGTFSNTGMGHILFYKGMWTSFYGQDAIGRDCFDELHTVCNSREVIDNIHDNPELLEV